MKKVLLFLLTFVLALSVVLSGCAGPEQAIADQPQPDDTLSGTAEADTPEADTAEADTPEADTNASEDNRVEAPDFTVYDAEGNPVKLSDFHGKPVVLNFWASWCGPCKAEMPDFEQTYKELGEQVQFMIVNLTDGHDETVEIASGYIASQGYTFPVFYDTDSEASYLYGIRSIPTTYFIDAEGYAVAMYTGSMSAEILMDGISIILPTG